MSVAPAGVAQIDERVRIARRNWEARIIANGVDHATFEATLARIRRWEDWCDEFAASAEQYEALARAAEEARHPVTAREAWYRAAMCWHFGKFVFMDDPERAAAAQQRMSDDYVKGIGALDPPGKRVLVPYRGIEMAAILRLPVGPTRPPVVVMVPGLDSTKEEVQATADLILRRGMATLAIDGPGQGETERLLLIEPSYEHPVAAAIDYLERLTEVDASRIGLYGVSLGGYYVIRAAAFEPRVRAVTDVAGPFDFSSHWTELPPMTRMTFQRRAGLATDEEARRRAGELSLKGLGTRVTQPLLVVHGTVDPLVPYSEALAIKAEVPGATLLTYEGSNHGVTDRAFESRSALADWLGDQLGAR